MLCYTYVDALEVREITLTGFIKYVRDKSGNKVYF